MKIKLKDKTIEIDEKKEDDMEWIKAKAEELSVFFENFIDKMDSFLHGHVDEEYFAKKIYAKTFGEVNEFIDEKLHWLFSRIQNQYYIRKPFKLVLWAMMNRGEILKKENRAYYTVSAIACRMIDTHAYIIQNKEEEKNPDGHQLARTELKCRGYFGEEIRLECKKIYGDLEL
jgi:hypothetical protein